MEDLVVLELLVEKSVADEVTQKKVAEIAMRRADAKFKSIIKCRVLGDSVSNNDVPHRVASSALQLGFSRTNSVESIRGTIRAFEKRLGTQVTALTETTKNMAVQVDNIYSLTSSVRAISYLNTGISMANLVVDVVGFIVVNNKLNALNTEVLLVANNVNKIANAQKNEKIAECQKLIMRFNSISSKLQNGDVVNLDDLENLIIDMRAYISEMILNLHDEALGTELILKIIFSLLPAYTLLFGDFTKHYYYEAHNLPANYEMFLKLYDELESVNFRGKLHDYYFLDQKMHSQEVLDVLNAQTLLGLNGRVQIEDQTSILQILETQEKVEAFDKGLDRVICSWAKEKVPVIANNSGVSEEECLKLFDTAFSSLGD